MFFDMFQIFYNRDVLILFSEKKNRTKTKPLKLDGYGNLLMNFFCFFDIWTSIPYLSFVEKNPAFS